ncbi:MAG: hypothetical protein U9Q37_01665 [Euryarchaeota archaeon]|nr:hypothetical protein [Euryarchaeota archaeon]
MRLDIVSCPTTVASDVVLHDVIGVVECSVAFGRHGQGAGLLRLDPLTRRLSSRRATRLAMWQLFAKIKQMA